MKVWTIKNRKFSFSKNCNVRIEWIHFKCFHWVWLDRSSSSRSKLHVQFSDSNESIKFLCCRSLSCFFSITFESIVAFCIFYNTTYSRKKHIHQINSVDGNKRSTYCYSTHLLRCHCICVCLCVSNCNLEDKRRHRMWLLFVFGFWFDLIWF